MPLLKLDRLCDGLEKGDWAGFLRDWDRALRAGNHPETTRYNYLSGRRPVGEVSDRGITGSGRR